ncbi:MAG: hypothetical protein ACLFU8_01400 [Anaerolineales bacterium]
MRHPRVLTLLLAALRLAGWAWDEKGAETFSSVAVGAPGGRPGRDLGGGGGVGGAQKSIVGSSGTGG